MISIRRSALIALALPTLALFSTAGRLRAQAPLPMARHGVMDLRDADLSKGPLPLFGEWALYWHQLRTPASAPAEPTLFVDFPRHWPQTVVNGAALPARGYATYTLTVLLPQRHGVLALDVPSAYTATRLFVNGVVVASSGSPDTSEATAVPHWLEQTVDVPPGSDTLQLMLQIANFWHSKGGPYRELVIGERATLVHDRQKESAFDLLLTGCLLMGGLFFFGLYWYGERDRAILFFSLFCVTYSYRVIGVRQYVLHSMFPGLPWTLTTHVEYLSLFLSIAFFAQYTYSLFPKDASRVVMRGITWLCLGLVAIVVLFPPSIFTRLINPFLILMFSVIAYAFVIYVRAYRNQRLGAGYALWSTGVLLVNFALINLEYFRIVAPQRGLLFIGYATFFLLQSQILSFRFAFALTQAKERAEQGSVAKSEFLSTMSHEIRTPLNSILGMTHLILRDQPRPEQKEQLNVLLYSANNLLAIVNDILDYNKIEAGKVLIESVELDVPDLVRQVSAGLRSAADAKGIELRVVIDPALTRRVLGDPTRLGQILTNLVSNAIKFTERGYVLLDVLVESQTVDAASVTFSVEDTGIGIPVEKQGVIFESFAQADTSTSRRFGGTGLGLAICKRLVMLQGSELLIRSEVGRGSEFFFTLRMPIAPATGPHTDDARAAVPSDESRPLDGVAILLVEDNEVNILVARAFLERWGAHIDVARNGQEALDRLDVTRHQLVLMDMHMSVMDGYEATRRMRANGVTLPIIAITASLSIDAEEKVRHTGLDAIVLKPFVPDDLLRTVLHFSGRAPAPPARRP